MGRTARIEFVYAGGPQHYWTVTICVHGVYRGWASVGNVAGHTGNWSGNVESGPNKYNQKRIINRYFRYMEWSWPTVQALSKFELSSHVIGWHSTLSC